MLAVSSSASLRHNPNQDGYPDLLDVSQKESLDYYNSITAVREGYAGGAEKSMFSPYRYGGIEVKATCGNTPSARTLRKPLIGETRLPNLVSFEWKAHHRNTNRMVAILWDFLDGNPAAVACFYADDLTMDDWGKLVTPGEGSHTTSVSIMTQQGVSRVCKHWMVVINRPEYIAKLAKRNWIGQKVNGPVVG
jgi:hypothetical protein